MKKVLSDTADVIDKVKKQLEILENEECVEILNTFKHRRKEKYETNPKEVKNWVVKRNTSTFKLYFQSTPIKIELRNDN